jgi:alanyl-tRNA synthetase
MTSRLYYTDPYLASFEARVVSLAEVGGRPAVILDRSAFYPSSGGQPCDTGVLGQARVTAVEDLDEGEVAHIVEGTLQPGDAVTGRIDWQRRWDHMQQHTGQHVLSAAFDRGPGVRTVSFHLGAESSTIDLAREVTPAEVRAVEAEANRVVWENRPVAIRFASAEEAAKLPLRKEPARTGPLRLIDVEDWDLSACGGTHVSRTGAIGIIAISAVERFKGASRVSFVCGGRALGEYRVLREAVDGSIRLLSVLPSELPAAIERLQMDTRELRRSLKALTERLAAFEAEEIAARAEPRDGIRQIVEQVDTADAGALKALAAAIAARPGRAVALVSNAEPRLAVVARSSDVSMDSGAVLRRLTAALGGKGGGRPELAQGGGLTGSVEAVLAEARAALAGAVSRDSA